MNKPLFYRMAIMLETRKMPNALPRQILSRVSAVSNAEPLLLRDPVGMRGCTTLPSCGGS